MTTDVKLLPLPEPAVTHDVLGGLYTPLQARDYARANMEPLIAENERLRGEVERAQYAAGRWENVAKSQASWELLWSEEKARAAQLAEIKDFLRRAAPYARAIVRAQTETEEREACRALAKLYNDDLDALLSREEG